MATTVIPTVALNTDNLFPWKDIRDVMVAGQQMVFIPKFYVKNMLVNTYNAYFICGTQKSGYHLHPAFYNNGTPVTNGILIGKYLATGTAPAIYSISSSTPTKYKRQVAYDAINSKNLVNGTSDQTGWHPYHIYEHSLILRLALIEYGGTNFTNLNEYHGICDIGKTAANGKTTITDGYWVDGLKAKCGSDSTKFSWLISNKTRTAEVETAQQAVSSTYVRLMSMTETNDYDLGDLFLVDQAIAQTSGSYGATQACSGFKVNTTNPYYLCKTFNFGLTKRTIDSKTGLNTEAFYFRFAKYC